MEWGRSAQTGVMQVVTPGQGVYLMPVVWYFAPVGAKTYYGFNAFVSGNWDRDRPELPPQLGAQPPYASPYYGGDNPWGYVGQCVIGSPDQFAGGLTLAEATGPSRPLASIPLCCRVPIFPPIGGGAVVNGVALQGLVSVSISGGVLLGGLVDSGFYREVEGGASIGGEVISDFQRSSEGGVKVGGEVISDFQRSSEGGVKVGGGISSDFHRESAGSLKFGGTVLTDFHREVRDGIMKFGGNEKVSDRAVSGGVKIGGPSGKIILPLTVIGGVRIGGTVNIPPPKHVVGGVRVGGRVTLLPHVGGGLKIGGVVTHS
jgi:hypothetical protein